ncbi:hypothetical protein [Bradyrhizobium sp. BR 10261]|uniref:hypothetical protein n=1 Tax=Bradyrhizobium sp. BR 10261 TaxID=2749992 RepID=UPI00390899F5
MRHGAVVESPKREIQTLIGSLRRLNAAAPDFLRTALARGAARCLRQPFTPDALLAAIRD